MLASYVCFLTLLLFSSISFMSSLWLCFLQLYNDFVNHPDAPEYASVASFAAVEREQSYGCLI